MANLSEVLGSALNISEQEKIRGAFDPIPAGTYKVAIMKYELKENKDNPNNKYLEVDFSVVEGEFKNSRLQGYFVLVNTDAEKVKKGKGYLALLCEAIGLTTELDDLDVLLNNIILLKAILLDDTYNGETAKKNFIVSYSSAQQQPQQRYNQAQQQQPQQAQQQQQPQQEPPQEFGYNDVPF